LGQTKRDGGSDFEWARLKRGFTNQQRSEKDDGGFNWERLKRNQETEKNAVAFAGKSKTTRRGDFDWGKLKRDGGLKSFEWGRL